MPVTTTSVENRDPAVRGRYPSPAADHAAQIASALSDLRAELESRGFVWTRFAGVDASGVYGGTNAELDSLHELKALELIHRSLTETADDRWERAASHYAQRFYGRRNGRLFTTYDTDGNGSVSGGETARGYRPVKLGL